MKKNSVWRSLYTSSDSIEFISILAIAFLFPDIRRSILSLFTFMYLSLNHLKRIEHDSLSLLMIISSVKLTFEGIIGVTCYVSAFENVDKSQRKIMIGNGPKIAMNYTPHLYSFFGFYWTGNSILDLVSWFQNHMYLALW